MQALSLGFHYLAEGILEGKTGAFTRPARYGSASPKIMAAAVNNRYHLSSKSSGSWYSIFMNTMTAWAPIGTMPVTQRELFPVAEETAPAPAAPVSLYAEV